MLTASGWNSSGNSSFSGSQGLLQEMDGSGTGTVRSILEDIECVGLRQVSSIDMTLRFVAGPRSCCCREEETPLAPGVAFVCGLRRTQVL